MNRGSITIVEGRDLVGTALSLQFVYRGSTVWGEYGCFLSCAKTLESIERIMNHHGMSSSEMENAPSIVMLDAARLGKITSGSGKTSSRLEPFLPLLEEIYRDIKFTRLAIDGIDALSNGTRKDLERFFDFARMNDIKALLTINFNLRPEDSDLLEMCDSYIVIKRGNIPLILFS